jgi:hypothetical protein
VFTLLNLLSVSSTHQVSVFLAGVFVCISVNIEASDPMDGKRLMSMTVNRHYEIYDPAHRKTGI